jgi:diguanylate cyclase (GGDEF)-like protein
VKNTLVIADTAEVWTLFNLGLAGASPAAAVLLSPPMNNMPRLTDLSQPSTRRQLLLVLLVLGLIGLGIGVMASSLSVLAQWPQDGRLEHERVLQVRHAWLVLGLSTCLNLGLLAGLVHAWRRAEVRQSVARDAMAHQNERLALALQVTARRNEQVHVLSDLSRRLQALAHLEEATALLRDNLPALVDAPSGALYLIAGPAGQLHRECEWGEAAFDEYVDPEDCWAVQRGQTHAQPAQPGTSACRHLHDTVRSGMRCIPLLAHGEVAGMLVVDQPGQEAETQQSEHQRHLEMMLEQVALSITNLKLREALRQQSIRDPMTGLYNRRFLEESLQRELQRAERLAKLGEYPGFALMMLDIDHLSRFNGEHGHEAGDEVLCEVAALLQKHSRGSDVAARHGGQGFTLMLPDMPREAAYERAERVRHDVLQIKVSAAGQSSVTVSIGLVHFPRDAASAEGLFQAANKALGRAKRIGRNRVEMIGKTDAVDAGELFSSNTPASGSVH